MIIAVVAAGDEQQRRGDARNARTLARFDAAFFAGAFLTAAALARFVVAAGAGEGSSDCGTAETDLVDRARFAARPPLRFAARVEISAASTEVRSAIRRAYECRLPRRRRSLAHLDPRPLAP